MKRLSSVPVAILIIFASILPLCAQLKRAKSDLAVPTDFKIDSAMFALFGNYDPKADSSRFVIPQGFTFDFKGSQFEIGDEIVQVPFWASTVVEDGIRKVVFLTYAVPKESFGRADNDLKSFTCEACAPLIGAAVFARRGEKWEIEASSPVATRAGGLGDSPADIRIVRIGPQRIGIEVREASSKGGENTDWREILVPWKGGVNVALGIVTADNNRGNCGVEDELSCYSNRKKMYFIQGTNFDYFDITLALSGTDLMDKEPYKPYSVHGFERLSFQSGFYRTVKRSGDRTTLETEIETKR
jgi:hypothetical protein